MKKGLNRIFSLGVLRASASSAYLGHGVDRRESSTALRRHFCKKVEIAGEEDEEVLVAVPLLGKAAADDLVAAVEDLADSPIAAIADVDEEVEELAEDAAADEADVSDGSAAPENVLSQDDLWTRATVFDDEAGRPAALMWEKMDWNYERTLDGLRQMVYVRRGKKRAFFRKLDERQTSPSSTQAREAARQRKQAMREDVDPVFASHLSRTLTEENTPRLNADLRAQLQPQVDMYARGIGLNPSWSLEKKHKFMNQLVKFFNEDPEGHFFRMQELHSVFGDRKTMKEMSPADVRELIAKYQD